jgi:peptidoglycan/xylan/chitin deacetylase (PgdA/CDA1 family)
MPDVWKYTPAPGEECSKVAAFFAVKCSDLKLDDSKGAKPPPERFSAGQAIIVPTAAVEALQGDAVKAQAVKAYKEQKRLVVVRPKFGVGKKIILSFDDGPAPPLKGIIEILRSNNILAEFYVVGKAVRNFPEGAKMIVDAGHAIQNHSWSHGAEKQLLFKNLSKEDLIKEICTTQEAVASTTNVAPNTVRPPFGSGYQVATKDRDKELLAVAEQLKLKLIGWDIDTLDWAPHAPGISPPGQFTADGRTYPSKLAWIEEQFTWKHNRTKEVLNVLMHVLEPTRNHLQGFIDLLRDWGFQFATPQMPVGAGLGACEPHLKKAPAK